MKNFILGAFGVFALLAVPVQAGMIGDTTDVAVYYPNLSTLVQDGGNKTVTTSTEYPAGTFNLYNSNWAVDITNTQIIIEYTGSSCSACVFTTASFNGFVVTLVTGGPFLTAVADGASNFNPAITINGNVLDLNYSGVSYAPDSESIIDITNAPEPATFSLLGAGLVGFYFIRRRRG